MNPLGHQSIRSAFVLGAVVSLAGLSLAQQAGLGVSGKAHSQCNSNASVKTTPLGTFLFGNARSNANQETKSLLSYLNSTMVAVPGEDIARVYNMTCTNQAYESPQGCGNLHPLSLGQITILVDVVLPAVYQGSAIYSYCGPQDLISSVSSGSAVF